MLWQNIREKYPKKWLVIEAKKFHQAEDKFVVEDLEVLDIFDKSFDAYDEYRTLRRSNLSREFLFANTEMPILEIPTTRWLVVPTNQCRLYKSTTWNNWYG